MGRQARFTSTNTTSLSSFVAGTLNAEVTASLDPKEINASAIIAV
jgi:hypothetical protein